MKCVINVWFYAIKNKNNQQSERHDKYYLGAHDRQQITETPSTIFISSHHKPQELGIIVLKWLVLSASC